MDKSTKNPEPSFIELRISSKSRHQKGLSFPRQSVSPLQSPNSCFGSLPEREVNENSLSGSSMGKDESEVTLMEDDNDKNETLDYCQKSNNVKFENRQEPSKPIGTDKLPEETDHSIKSENVESNKIPSDLNYALKDCESRSSFDENRTNREQLPSFRTAFSVRDEILDMVENYSQNRGSESEKPSVSDIVELSSESVAFCLASLQGSNYSNAPIEEPSDLSMTSLSSDETPSDSYHPNPGIPNLTDSTPNDADNRSRDLKMHENSILTAALIDDVHSQRSDVFKQPESVPVEILDNYPPRYKGFQFHSDSVDCQDQLETCESSVGRPSTYLIDSSRIRFIPFLYGFENYLEGLFTESSRFVNSMKKVSNSSQFGGNISNTQEELSTVFPSSRSGMPFSITNSVGSTQTTTTYGQDCWFHSDGANATSNAVNDSSMTSQSQSYEQEPVPDNYYVTDQGLNTCTRPSLFYQEEMYQTPGSMMNTNTELYNQAYLPVGCEPCSRINLQNSGPVHPDYGVQQSWNNSASQTGSTASMFPRSSYECFPDSTNSSTAMESSHDVNFRNSPNIGYSRSRSEPQTNAGMPNSCLLNSISPAIASALFPGESFPNFQISGPQSQADSWVGGNVTMNNPGTVNANKARIATSVSSQYNEAPTYEGQKNIEIQTKAASSTKLPTFAGSNVENVGMYQQYTHPSYNVNDLQFYGNNLVESRESLTSLEPMSYQEICNKVDTSGISTYPTMSHALYDSRTSQNAPLCNLPSATFGQTPFSFTSIRPQSSTASQPSRQFRNRFNTTSVRPPPQLTQNPGISHNMNPNDRTKYLKEMLRKKCQDVLGTTALTSLLNARNSNSFGYQNRRTSAAPTSATGASNILDKVGRSSKDIDVVVKAPSATFSLQLSPCNCNNFEVPGTSQVSYVTSKYGIPHMYPNCPQTLPGNFNRMRQVPDPSNMSTEIARNNKSAVDLTINQSTEVSGIKRKRPDSFDIPPTSSQIKPLLESSFLSGSLPPNAKTVVTPPNEASPVAHYSRPNSRDSSVHIPVVKRSNSSTASLNKHILSTSSPAGSDHVVSTTEEIGGNPEDSSAIEEGLSNNTVDSFQTEQRNVDAAAGTQADKGDVPFGSEGKDRPVPVDTKPRHYEMQRLQIGTFVADSRITSYGKTADKFKVHFARRPRFVYQIEKPNSSKLSDCVENEEGREMVCIIVPFTIIKAVRCREDLVQILVKQQPLICLGQRRKRSGGIVGGITYSSDDELNIFTNDQVKKCPLHTILLRKNFADKLKSLLCQFDSTFEGLTSMSFPYSINIPKDFELPMCEAEVHNKVEPKEVQQPRPKRQRRLSFSRWNSQAWLETVGTTSTNSASSGLSSEQRTVEEGLPTRSLPSGGSRQSAACSCRISCRSIRCSCVKLQKRCNESPGICLCANCDNPLNVLEHVGIDSNQAVLDPCLIQNIYKHKPLKVMLLQTIHTPCCGHPIQLKDCIPDIKDCPTVGCEGRFQYSWCHEALYDARHTDGRHCIVCQKCKLDTEVHCLTCRKCYSSSKHGPRCPRCKTISNPDRIIMPVRKDANTVEPVDSNNNVEDHQSASQNEATSESMEMSTSTIMCDTNTEK